MGQVADGEARRSNPDFVEALARGLEVLQCFSEDSPEMTLTEVAEKVGLSAATARRSLLTLVELGYVGTHGKRFLLRPRVLTLGSAFLNSMNLKSIADGYLSELAELFHDACSLAVLDGPDVLYVSHISSPRDIRYRARVGYKLPAYATSLGLVLLAGQSSEAQESYLARGPFERYTSRTHVEPKVLTALFGKARLDGFAAVQDQLEYGVVAVAVPVKARSGQVVAAINCSALSERVDLESLIETRVPALQAAARQIGNALARHPALVNSVLSSPAG